MDAAADRHRIYFCKLPKILNYEYTKKYRLSEINHRFHTILAYNISLNEKSYQLLFLSVRSSDDGPEY